MQSYMPTKIIIDNDVIEKNKDIFTKLGNKCLIVTGKNSAKVCGALDDLINVLDEYKIEYQIFDKIIQNPLMQTCIEAGRIAHEYHADFVVGIGGGSVLDSAKLIALIANNPELEEDTIYKKEWKNNRLPIILVGLTSGTGSEVTNSSVCTTKEGNKKSVSDELLYADIALGDPKYTLSLSYHFTISTALDALAHAYESYFSKKANNLSRSASFAAINLLWNNLKYLRNKDAILSLEQRRQLYEASILAGIAINMTGCVFPHNLGYYLTEEYNLSHGIASALFVEDLIKHEREINNEYVDEFFNALRINEEDFINVINDSLPDNNIKLNIEEIEKALPRWKGNKTVDNTLGDISLDKIKEILINKFI